MPTKPKPTIKIKNPELINLLARKEVNHHHEITYVQKKIIKNLPQNFFKKNKL